MHKHKPRFPKWQRWFKFLFNIHRLVSISTVRKRGITGHLGRVCNTKNLQSLRFKTMCPFFWNYISQWIKKVATSAKCFQIAPKAGHSSCTKWSPRSLFSPLQHMIISHSVAARGLLQQSPQAAWDYTTPSKLNIFYKLLNSHLKYSSSSERGS